MSVIEKVDATGKGSRAVTAAASSFDGLQKGGGSGQNQPQQQAGGANQAAGPQGAQGAEQPQQGGCGCGCSNSAKRCQCGAGNCCGD